MMKMRCILLSILSVVITTVAFAQDRAECERIAGVVFEAVGRQDIEQIKPHLSEVFEVSGQTSPIAGKVLEMLVGNLGGIKSFTLTEAKADTCLTLNYDVEYEKHGKKQAAFVFDRNNRIKKMNLLTIKVKTAKRSPSDIIYNPSNVIEIPFEMMKNLIIVKATLNGEERDFLLDSGSRSTIINSKYVGEATSADKQGATAISNSRGVHDEALTGMNVEKASIDFYGIRIEEKEMLTLDISHLEGGGRQIYGLIGYELIQKYDVLYDYNRKVITLIAPDYFETYRKEKLAGHFIETVPLEMRGHIPIVPVKIGDDYYKMGIDCGAGVGLLDINLFVPIKSLLKKISSESLSGASKGKKEVTKSRLKKFHAGTTAYKNMQFVFSDIAHLNKDKEVKIDGLLGYEFLSKHPTLISYQRKELLLIK
ncbi:aspartyl protease family protein [Bacteroides pyogenes]|uniref:aspartyl protease family protein n=1 Tax=Bacteroides pyogenes TaxID=310300 RepID=UPI003B431891